MLKDMSLSCAVVLSQFTLATDVQRQILYVPGVVYVDDITMAELSECIKTARQRSPLAGEISIHVQHENA